MTKQLHQMSDAEKNACKREADAILKKFLTDLSALPFPFRGYVASHTASAMRKILREEQKDAAEHEKAVKAGAAVS